MKEINFLEALSINKTTFVVFVGAHGANVRYERNELRHMLVLKEINVCHLEFFEGKWECSK